MPPTLPPNPFFFFNYPPTTEIYTLSLHDALPILLVPYADWNLLKFPDKDRAMEKILDLTMLSDIFPTGFHGAVTAGVGPGSTVYDAGAGPVGLRSEEHTSELQSHHDLVCRLLLEK